MAQTLMAAFDLPDELADAPFYLFAEDVDVDVGARFGELEIDDVDHARGREIMELLSQRILGDTDLERNYLDTNVWPSVFGGFHPDASADELVEFFEDEGMQVHRISDLLEWRCRERSKGEGREQRARECLEEAGFEAQPEIIEWVLEGGERPELRCNSSQLEYKKLAGIFDGPVEQWTPIQERTALTMAACGWFEPVFEAAGARDEGILDRHKMVRDKLAAAGFDDDEILCGVLQAHPTWEFGPTSGAFYVASQAGRAGWMLDQADQMRDSHMIKGAIRAACLGWVEHDDVTRRYVCSLLDDGYLDHAEATDLVRAMEVVPEDFEQIARERLEATIDNDDPDHFQLAKALWMHDPQQFDELMRRSVRLELEHSSDKPIEHEEELPLMCAAASDEVWQWLAEWAPSHQHDDAYAIITLCTPHFQPPSESLQDTLRATAGQIDDERTERAYKRLLREYDVLEEGERPAGAGDARADGHALVAVGGGMMMLYDARAHDLHDLIGTDADLSTVLSDGSAVAWEADGDSNGNLSVRLTQSELTEAERAAARDSADYCLFVETGRVALATRDSETSVELPAGAYQVTVTAIERDGQKDKGRLPDYVARFVRDRQCYNDAQRHTEVPRLPRN